MYSEKYKIYQPYTLKLKRTNSLERKKLLRKMKVDYPLIALVLPLACLIVIIIQMFVCFKYTFQNDQVKIEPCMNGIVLVQINNKLNELESKVDKVIII